MHTEQQLKFESLVLQEDGQRCATYGLLPDWDVHDRFGIVVTEPLGALGASLLIQAAVAMFYEADANRRVARTAQYPDIYLFHIEGPWGDHSPFDFWPPRKEILCGAEPLAVLEAINDRAITRLAIPQGPAGELADLSQGPSTWAEHGSFRGRIRSCFAYDAGGSVAGGSVVLSSRDVRFDQNTDQTLNPGALAQDLAARGGVVPPEYLVGPSQVVDLERYNAHVQSRAPEVDPATLREIRERWLAGRVEGDERAERYARISPDDALALIAGLSRAR